MYDNINFDFSNEFSPDTNFLTEIPKHLSVISNQGKNQFGEYITGFLDSLKISITKNKLRIYDSSLCKYYLGDNFKTLTKGDTKRAIERISDSLHLPFQLAIVTRLDAAKNLIMQHDEKIYYPYLGEAQYYNRLPQNNGIYYTNNLRQLVFYGKVYEQQMKKQPIPELYNDRHTLRFEIRFKKRICQQLIQPHINAKMLSDEVFFKGIVKRWEKEYFAIQKINSKLNTMKPTGSKKELFENLALFTVLELGQPQLLNTIKEWQEMGSIDKKQAYDLRTAIKQLSKTPIDEKGNELINELNKKIKEAARNW